MTGPLSHLGDGIRLQFARNPGAFMSLGAGLSDGVRYWIFNVTVSIFLMALAVFLRRTRSLSPHSIVGLTLILGGGIGNLTDRFLYASMTDFLIVGFSAMRTGIFNFADLAIVLGVILLGIRHTSKLRDWLQAWSLLIFRLN